MKNIFKIIVYLFFVIFILESNEVIGESLSKTDLILISETNQVIKGNTLWLKLIITGNGADSVIKDTKNLNMYYDDIYEYNSFNFIQPGRFEYNFSIKPDKPGKLILGPYKIKFQDEMLVSNALTIDVVELSAKEKTLILKCDYKNPVSNYCNITIEGSLECIEDIEFINNDYLELTGSSFSSRISKGDKIISSIYETTFMLKTKKNGKVKLTKKNFKNIPPDCKIQPLTIEIEQE